jgi:uncharacterized protein (UPF0261 family)
MATVVLLGTLDTKRAEYTWLRDRVAEAGCRAYLVDVGVYSDGTGLADVTVREVAGAAGADLDALRRDRDRGAAVRAMAEGAAVLVQRLHRDGELDALLAVGGSGGSSIAARAMSALPVGVPKLLVSTMASGDVRPYVGEVDVTLMYSVVDIAGINSISARVLSNAVAAVTGMARAYADRRSAADTGAAPLIGLTMFGVTTPAADEARATLTALGYEVLVFHATGSGGRAMEKLVESGLLAGVLDLTTTELADELVGGVLSAGPDRLTAAGRHGLPQVVSVGALDMVNFGPRDTVPERFAQRRFVVHNPTVTLMRTTQEEMAGLGRIIAGKLREASGPAEVFLPLGGVSALDVPGGPFHDEAADARLFEAIRTGLAGSRVVVHESPVGINEPGFGAQLAQALHRLIDA